MKQIKTLVTFGLVLTLLFSLAACSTDSKDDSKDTIETADDQDTNDTTDLTEVPDSEVIPEGTDITADVDTTDTDTIVILERRTFGEISLPQTADEVPLFFEEVATLFPADTTEEVKTQAFELFTAAELAEIANNSEVATAAWTQFDTLNLLAE